ncbi:MAG: hypothetical protein ONB05_02155 [candidate division KSB1 bacterium]|nr:hypothetical protein [candidate division KSB1 bacterium]
MVNIWEKFLHRLDQASFGGLKIWEFSIKSLIRQYGLIFLWEIVFKYPGRAIRGLFKYRRFIQERKDRDELVYVSEQPEGIWWQNWKKDRENRLVAVGFCQKLQPTPENPSGCPSGRFNHDCVYLDSGNNGSKPFYSACKTCDVKRIGILALKTGANLYIMTSARDIARRILIPALRRRRYT